MTDLLIVLVLVAVLAGCIQSWLIWKKLNSGEEQRKLEENVQRAMDRMAAEVDEARDRAASKTDIGSMDEGFENLMTYHVKLGRGKTSGGEPWNV